jgi:hypothetical protein
MVKEIQINLISTRKDCGQFPEFSTVQGAVEKCVDKRETGVFLSFLVNNNPQS